ncbi:hypothetical protein Cgig2_011340 [Carnegiea gigantea]|uniref:Uncharacterized protein n=1 Tax=Carnegiea gigantea TaxID=171969 RepID=A0A9Q1JU24_9CARY|nr:hypothetical protein Cgig2_011340 [Carnegiea gigantea]
MIAPTPSANVPPIRAQVARVGLSGFAPKSPIACGGIISAITYAWKLEPLIRWLTLLFQGGRLDLASCINTETFKIEGGHVFINHHSRLLFPSRTPQKPLVPTRRIGCMIMTLLWRSMRMTLNLKEGMPLEVREVLGVLGPRPHHHEEEEYDPPLTRSHTKAGSSGFNEAHFYQYMDVHFSRLNLRLNVINKRQQKHAQDEQELLHRQMEFDC